MIIFTHIHLQGSCHLSLILCRCPMLKSHLGYHWLSGSTTSPTCGMKARCLHAGVESHFKDILIPQKHWDKSIIITQRGPCIDFGKALKVFNSANFGSLVHCSSLYFIASHFSLYFFMLPWRQVQVCPVRGR